VERPPTSLRRRQLAGLDRPLLDALAAAPAELLRRVAYGAALRALTEAGMTDIDWIAAGLAAVETGLPLPKPIQGRRLGVADAVGGSTGPGDHCALTRRNIRQLEPAVHVNAPPCCTRHTRTRCAPPWQAWCTPVSGSVSSGGTRCSRRSAVSSPARSVVPRCRAPGEPQPRQIAGCRRRRSPAVSRDRHHRLTSRSVPPDCGPQSRRGFGFSDGRQRGEHVPPLLPHPPVTGLPEQVLAEPCPATSGGSIIARPTVK